MLAYLHVKNIALIKELEIDFNKGLNILTGETGAGKSILLGSINYVLGAKMKKDFIRQGTKEAFVECVFVVPEKEYENDGIKELFYKNGISHEETGIIINRKTTLSGRSVFRINGEVVRQDTVKQLSSLLIDIHSQHEHQSLLSSSRQLDLLDRYANEDLINDLETYQKTLKQYSELQASIENEFLDDDKRRREIAFIEFEINEIKDSHLYEGEDRELQSVYDRLSHSKEILTELSKLDYGLFQSEDIETLISTTNQHLAHFIAEDERLHNISESLYQLEDLLQMLKHDITDYNDRREDFEEELFHAEQRLDQINQLKLKYGDTIEQIYAYLENKEKEHRRLVNFEQNLLKTREEIQRLKGQLEELVQRLHTIRKEKAKELKGFIEEALWDLNLENTVFDINVEKTSKFGLKGSDKISFMISTNKGEELKPIKEVASGGELSRIMLAIKSVLAREDGVDTLIFDEIDTGISGLTAQRVAEKMANLASSRQLICITHLPQIAAMNDEHYLIHKEVEDEKTITYVDLLSEQTKINELARMLSGAITSNTVIDNAREMRMLAMEYKEKVQRQA